MQAVKYDRREENANTQDLGYNSSFATPTLPCEF